MHRRCRSDSSVSYSDYPELAPISEEEESLLSTKDESWRDAERRAHARALASIRLPPWTLSGLCLLVAFSLGLVQVALSGSSMANARPEKILLALLVNASFTNATALSASEATLYQVDCGWGDCALANRRPTGLWVGKLGGEFPPPTRWTTTVPSDGVNLSLTLQWFVDVMPKPQPRNKPWNATQPLAFTHIAVPDTLATVGTGPFEKHGTAALAWYSDVVSGAAMAAGLDAGRFYDVRGATGDWLGSVYIAMTYEMEWVGSGYCEAVQPGAAVDQPVNAYSNAAFMLAGAYMVAVGLNDLRRRGDERPSVMAERPLASIAFGATLACAGATSFAYHAQLRPDAESADMVGVYATALLPSFYCVFGSASALKDVACAVALFAACVYVISTLTLMENAIKVIILCVVLLASVGSWWRERWRVVAHRWVVAALGLAVFAFGVRQADAVMCDPQSPFQMHAVWHVGVAASLSCVWVFFRSEPSV